MRRIEKAVTEAAELEKIILGGSICRLAINAEPVPYLVPLNYGYREGALYFHSALAGRKIDLLRRNPQVAFEISIDLGIIEGAQACDWSARYRSVLGHGRVEFLETLEEKRQGLDILMAQYGEGEFSYPDAALNKTCIYRLVIAEMTGKQSRLED